MSERGMPERLALKGAAMFDHSDPTTDNPSKRNRKIACYVWLSVNDKAEGPFGSRSEAKAWAALDKNTLLYPQAQVVPSYVRD